MLPVDLGRRTRFVRRVVVREVRCEKSWKNRWKRTLSLCIQSNWISKNRESSRWSWSKSLAAFISCCSTNNRVNPIVSKAVEQCQRPSCEHGRVLSRVFAGFSLKFFMTIFLLDFRLICCRICRICSTYLFWPIGNLISTNFSWF